MSAIEHLETWLKHDMQCASQEVPLSGPWYPCNCGAAEIVAEVRALEKDEAVRQKYFTTAISAKCWLNLAERALLICSVSAGGLDGYTAGKLAEDIHDFLKRNRLTDGPVPETHVPDPKRAEDIQR